MNKTQLHYARKKVVTPQMQKVAQDEGIDIETVRTEIAEGRLIIPANINHKHVRPTGIGIATKCKINANIGNSSMDSDAMGELKKLKVCIECGADAVMDLSTGSDIDTIRREIISVSPLPVGTVPIYEAVEMVEKVENLTADQLFQVIEKHAEQGVDFITVHCGLLKRHLPLVKDRVTGIVSRGGSLIAQWMQKNDKENPLYTEFDRLLKICQKYDLSLSLGDGLRPGCLADASDQAQFGELTVLGELTRKAWEKEVQVMVEGPGHIPFNQIEFNIKKQIELCNGAPFYVLGPLVTDIAAGYDHITSAIGGTMAAYAGAAMLCYVTPKEHLGLPGEEDVRQGVIAHKIAAHAADIARGRNGARDRDDALSKARFDLDWEKQFELLLDPKRAKEYWHEARSAESRVTPALSKVEGSHESRACSMCGPKFCAMKLSKEVTKT